MLSRVAERMYWAGRYLERVENSARLVNSYADLLLDLPTEAGVGWPQLLKIVVAEDDFGQRYGAATEDNVLRFLLTDESNPGSVLSSLAYARENFRTSREIVPTEGWECVNELYLMGRDGLAQAVGRQRRFDVLSECVVRCQQITGLLSGTMSHGHGYNFLRIGNYLERADMSSRVVDVAAASLAGPNPVARPYENALWMGVLKSLSGYQMYRQYVRRRITPGDVVLFLLADQHFPRAVANRLEAVDRCLATLPRAEAARGVVADLHQRTGTDTVANLPSAELHIFIDRLQIGLDKLHGAIADTWFLKSNAS
jgi:uncharacterized alpha-E superfamily protein